MRRKCEKITLVRRGLNFLFPPVHWLRHRGANLKSMLSIVQRAARNKHSYLEFMLHSSELMPGGSPTFVTKESIEHLYRDLEVLFCHIAPYFKGATLTEYYQEFSATACNTDLVREAI